MLFQSGPNHPWLVKLYKRNVPYPLASTIAEELFQNNVIPSDTDFRIFAKYGGVSGFDIAHTFNGHVYHTKYDHFNKTPHITYELTGNNILALTRAVANSSEFSKIEVIMGIYYFRIFNSPLFFNTIIDHHNSAITDLVLTKSVFFLQID